MKLLVEDVEKLVDQGFKEVVLLGQTVNSYRDNGSDFGDLLYAVGEVNGLERVRFTSPHPADATERMIDAMASSPTVCKHLHLPLQSGSTPVLERMRRTYTAEEYRDLVTKLRERIPEHCALHRCYRRFLRRNRRRIYGDLSDDGGHPVRFGVHVQVFRT